MTKKQAEVVPGEAIAFRLPKNTPTEVCSHLTKIKQQGRGSLSNYSTDAVLEKAHREMAEEKQELVLHLPGELSDDKREWLKKADSKEILSRIVYSWITGDNLSRSNDEKSSKEPDKRSLAKKTAASMLLNDIDE